MMSAREIAIGLHGRKIGKSYIAKCPAHDDRNPSLSLRDGERGHVWIKCFAGCDKNLVIDKLRSRGLWPHRRVYIKKRPAIRSFAARPKIQENKVHYNLARQIWDESLPAQGTLVEVYLASRGLKLSPPNSIRFHPRLKHQLSNEYFPAMVANITDVNDLPMGIHRTYLKKDGTGKAEVSSAKMMLGPCAGGVVWLTEPQNELMIGEGIETCLSAMQEARRPVWAALSTSGLTGLKLPPSIKKVILLADADEAGKKAAETLGMRLLSEGRTVQIARPGIGKDFNDRLVAHLSSLRSSR